MTSLPFEYLAALVLLCTFVSYQLVVLIISRSVKSGLIDQPNERSSHTIPTPRGGGVGFVLTFLAAMTVLCFVQDQKLNAALGLLRWMIPTCATVAVLGFLDDRFSLRASVRLFVQIAAAAVSLFLLLGPWIVAAPSMTLFAGIFLSALGLLWIVWMTNLYNFMDGIDGYAALEAVLVALAMFGICLSRSAPDAALVYIVFGAAVAGFLILNWSPAEIFMGDAGSTFIGFFFGISAIAFFLKFDIPLETTLVLLGTFVVDATYTLMIRVLRGKKAHVAHRDHAYQHAVQRGWTHSRTVLFFAAITVFWLTPIAIWISMTEPAETIKRISLTVLAFAPLVIAEIYFSAGIERK